VAGIVRLGNIVQAKIIPDGFSGVPQAGAFLKLLADMAGLWMWGLCLWFLLVSIGAHWTLLLRWRQSRGHRERHIIHFDMTWYSFVFPNTAMVTATQAVGKTLDARAIQVFGTVMACLLVLMWLFVFGMMIRAFLLKRLLWPALEKRPEMEIERTATARSTGRRTGEE
jgi:tellurite resistance protein TehA-like permease